jgi:hypothetical protein
LSTQISDELDDEVSKWCRRMYVRWHTETFRQLFEHKLQKEMKNGKLEALD